MNSRLDRATRQDHVSPRLVGGGLRRRWSRGAASAITVSLCALLLAACGPGPDDTGGSPEAEPEEFAFGGTVQSVDTTTRIVSVANDDVPGWMMAMTMNYFVEPAEILGTLQPGDRIEAKVYAGDFQNLYEVEVVPDP